MRQKKQTKRDTETDFFLKKSYQHCMTSAVNGCFLLPGVCSPIRIHDRGDYHHFRDLGVLCLTQPTTIIGEIPHHTIPYKSRPNKTKYHIISTESLITSSHHISSNKSHHIRPQCHLRSVSSTVRPVVCVGPPVALVLRSGEAALLQFCFDITIAASGGYITKYLD